MKITLEPGDIFIPSNKPDDAPGQVTFGLVLSDTKCILLSLGTHGVRALKSEPPEANDFEPVFFQKDRACVPSEILQIFDALILAMDLPQPRTP